MESMSVMASDMGYDPRDGKNRDEIEGTTQDDRARDLGMMSEQLKNLSMEVFFEVGEDENLTYPCLLYTSPSPRDKRQSRMPSSA